MKNTKWLLVLAGLLVVSCRMNNLPYNPNKIEKIVIGADTKGKPKEIYTIDDPEDIASFLKNLKYGGERDYTVKHKLPGYVFIHMAGGQINGFRFENRIMRFNRREYVLSQDAAKVLKEKLRNLSNKALQLTWHACNFGP